jgi:hypothetical protein
MSKTKNKSVNQLVLELKKSGQDYEFYPSTDSQLAIIKQDMDATLSNSNYPSVLDVGAGNGSALNYLTDGKRYAIEKSTVLINELNSPIFIVGTSFFGQNLFDKKVSCIFSNPPYSEFISWAIKIINEAHAKCIYLILPERWAENEDIKLAIATRKATATILGSSDFLEADRVARGKVDIVKIDLTSSGYNDNPLTNPFSLWFDQNFPIAAGRSKYEATRNKTFCDREGCISVGCCHA